MNILQKLVLKKYGKYGQYFFYRCRGCFNLISKQDIILGGCKCGGQYSPARLSLLEEFGIIMRSLWP